MAMTRSGVLPFGSYLYYGAICLLLIILFGDLKEPLYLGGLGKVYTIEHKLCFEGVRNESGNLKNWI